MLTDAAAIMTFLADRHGKFTHAPGSRERAAQDALMHRVPAVEDPLWWGYERNIQSVAEAVVGPFLQGETLTIADLLLVHCLIWPGRAGFAAPPAPLDGYLGAMMARLAFQRAATLP